MGKIKEGLETLAGLWGAGFENFKINVQGMVQWKGDI